MSTSTSTRSDTTATARGPVVLQEEVVTRSGARYALAFGRIVIGWLFFWAFLDKLFGLGYGTPAENAWINGGAPAQGYIGGAEGPIAGLLQSGFQNSFGDTLFMVGLAGIGPLADVPLFRSRDGDDLSLRELRALCRWLLIHDDQTPFVVDGGPQQALQPAVDIEDAAVEGLGSIEQR